MEIKVLLVLYLYPDGFKVGEYLSEDRIKKLVNCDTKDFNSCEDKKVIFTRNGTIFPIFYNQKNYVLVLTREKKGIEMGVKYSELKSTLIENFQEINESHMYCIPQHLENIAGLGIPNDSLVKESLDTVNVHYGADLRTFFQEFGRNNLGECIKIMDRFLNSSNSNLTYKKCLEKLQSGQRHIGKKEKNGEKQIDTSAYREIFIVMYPYKKIDNKTITKESAEGEIYLIKQQADDINRKGVNTKNLVDLIAECTKKERCRIFIAIHSIWANVDVAKFNEYLSLNNHRSTIIYFNFHRTPEFELIRIPLERIVYSKKSSKDFSILAQGIKKICLGENMLIALDQAMSLFRSLDIDLKGIDRVESEKKQEYLIEIKRNLLERNENYASYFRQKLANLRFFVSGDLCLSSVLSTKPNSLIFQNSNLKTEYCTDLEIVNEIEVLEKMTGIGIGRLPYIEEFLLTFEELLEKVDVQPINFLETNFGRFLEKWELSGGEFSHFSDWYEGLVNTLLKVKRKVRDIF